MQDMGPLTLVHHVGLGDVERVIVEQMFVQQIVGILAQQVRLLLLCVVHMHRAHLLGVQYIIRMVRCKGRACCRCRRP